jgi:hypothetical protein
MKTQNEHGKGENKELFLPIRKVKAKEEKESHLIYIINKTERKELFFLSPCTQNTFLRFSLYMTK